MSESLRLFVAAEMPETVRHALGPVLAHLRARQASSARLRWVALEAIHLTLNFLGNVAAGRVEDVAAAMRGVAARHALMALRLADLGAFPNVRSPRVLWAGIDGEVEALTSLRDKLERALADAGFDPDEQAFRPHLTLARARNGERPHEVAGLSNALADAGLPDGLDFAVESVALIRSTLGPGGASYETLASASLGG